MYLGIFGRHLLVEERVRHVFSKWEVNPTTRQYPVFFPTSSNALIYFIRRLRTEELYSICRFRYHRTGTTGEIIKCLLDIHLLQYTLLEMRCLALCTSCFPFSPARVCSACISSSYLFKLCNISLAISFTLSIPLNSRAPQNVIILPVVLFTILDHYLRRTDQQDRVIGTLLGRRTESEVEIRTAFAVLHSETDEQVAVDTEYHRTMYELHRKVNPKEVIVGWYVIRFCPSV